MTSEVRIPSLQATMNEKLKDQWVWAVVSNTYIIAHGTDTLPATLRKIRKVIEDHQA